MRAHLTRPRPTTALAAAALLALAARPARAHAGRAPEPHDLWGAWTLAPSMVAPLLASAALYVVGVRALRRRTAPGHGIRRWEVAAFAAGWVTLVVALLSPVHALGEALFSAHMAQHELLVAVAAPLLVLGRPVIAALWALPPDARRLTRRVTGRRGVRRLWRRLTGPLVATAVHGLALWVWHAPALYSAALRSDVVHALQHASFLGTALLFWWALLSPHARRAHAGVGVAALFLTTLHTGALGALLAVSSRLWIPEYGATTAPWGMMPLEDQQLAGVIMWVPGSVAYAVAALALFDAWLTESGRRAARSARHARMLRARTLVTLLAAASLAAGVTACFDPGGEINARQAAALTGGDPYHGRTLISRYGCGTCHLVPGVPAADGMVGPALDNTARRSYIAGVMTNSPDNLVKWIRSPKQVDSLTAMPDLGVTEQDAKDMAAYLYSLH